MNEVIKVERVSPYIVEALPGQTLPDVIRAASCDAAYHRHGAILFRGFGITTVEAFRDAAHALPDPPYPYSYDSNKRTDLGDGIYTASDRARWVNITLHNECSYTRNWPMKLLFGCLQPATTGGETLLASTSAISSRINPSVLTPFREAGVLYVRNYRPGIDVPWQQVFHTHSRDEVEGYCAANDIEVEWRGADGLRTRQVAQAVATYPATGEELWFNQAHTYHISSLDERTRAALLATYAEEDLPRNVYYGDGRPIESAVIEHVRAAYRVDTTPCEWQAGDVLLVDNMRFVHGRAPFTGTRNVIVAMAGAYQSRKS
jgi:alpha-ketoglutarate-dependent taurine dioxygenase